ncbi:MAG: hypothetical protein QRY74_05050 [Chlamydia sp.]
MKKLQENKLFISYKRQVIGIPTAKMAQYKLSLNLITVLLALFISILSTTLPFSSSPGIKERILDELPFHIQEIDRALFWKNYQESTNHWLYRIIPRYRNQLHWYHIGPFLGWMFFGNEDDGLFGEGPKAIWEISTEPTLFKALSWFFRNPFHNYTFYILGTAAQEQKIDEFILLDYTKTAFRIGVYSPKASTVFSDKNHSLFFAFHAMRPFVSFRYTLSNNRRIEGFCGWRERGNFGLKCALRSDKERKVAPNY